MADGRDWFKGTRWYERDVPGSSPTDEIVGFIDNDAIDAQGYFGRYPRQPTYDGQPIDPALLYGEGWEAHHHVADPDPQPVTRPDQL